MRELDFYINSGGIKMIGIMVVI